MAISTEPEPGPVSATNASTASRRQRVHERAVDDARRRALGVAGQPHEADGRHDLEGVHLRRELAQRAQQLAAALLVAEVRGLEDHDVAAAHRLGDDLEVGQLPDRARPT